MSDETQGTYGDAIGSLVDQSKRLAKVEKERDELRAQLAQVKALAGEWERQGGMQALSRAERWQQSGLLACARDIRRTIRPVEATP